MSKNKRDNKVIIVEDAKGIAYGYKNILEREGYEITICSCGEEVKTIIDSEKQFDLAIVDIMLPTEDPQKFTLTECQETGVRLITQMIEKGTCLRFYVITVRGSLKERIERLCEANMAVMKFEHKLDYQPEKLVEHVEELLSRSTVARDVFTTEIREHVDIIVGYVKMINLLSEVDKEQLMASMASIQKILRMATDPDLGIDLKRAESILLLEYISKTKGALKQQAEKTLAIIQEWFKKQT